MIGETHRPSTGNLLHVQIEIARACGVSKGTLYVYFADKYRLFEAILEEEQIEQGKTAFNFDPSRDAETTLREFGRA